MSDSKICYREWLKVWLQQMEGRVKESTRANYSLAVMNHILPALGDCMLEELTEEKLQETLLFWLRCGRLDGRGGLSPKTAKDLMGVIKSSLHAARRHYHLPPEEIQLRYPSGGREKTEVLSLAGQKRLVAAACSENSPAAAGVLLALYTGLRIGEVCALQWRDIDLQERTLRVCKTVQRIFYKEWDGRSGSQLVITAPKTSSSLRTLPLAGFLVPVLGNLLCRDEEAYVLTGERDYLEPKRFRALYRRFLERHGLPPLRFHCLRHTFATRCIEDGADCKTVSALLGHASVSTTLDLYVHPQMEVKRRCVDSLPIFIDEASHGTGNQQKSGTES